MKYVSFLFHIYQPPVQEDEVLAAIVQQSYEPLTRIIKQFSDLKFTLNINFSLVELLSEKFPEIVDNIKTAYERGTLELTATGAYHPIFPLIPRLEVQRQIELNQRGNQRLLSTSFRPEGIFPPELAFTCRLVPLFKSLGYKWTIVDDGTLPLFGSEAPYNTIYSFNDFAVFFRSNFWANEFANYHGQWRNGTDFVRHLLVSLRSWMGDEDGYLIVALDGETFGHHHPELNEVFVKELCQALVSEKDRLQTAHLSDIYRRFPRVSRFIPPGSWSTDRTDVANRDYFSWWRSHRNRIHQLQWQLTTLLFNAVRSLGGNRQLNDEMDQALYSCQFWWASFWKFNPTEIYRGAFNMMQLLQKAAADRGERTLEEGEAVFRQLVTEVEKKRHGVEE
jgi:predicted glycosyl hydrolase (DUF1957 family)